MVDWNDLLSYTTVKLVQIHNWKLGLFHYLIQLAVLGYVLGWVIIYQKGYQGESAVVGTTTLKVKGSSYAINDGEMEIWDEHDVVMPPQESSALFVTTNFIRTENQTRTTCDRITKTSACSSLNPCPVNVSLEEGISTGECGPDGHCILIAWCPFENDASSPTNELVGVDNFTVFMKVAVRFPLYDISRDNCNGTNITPNFNLFAISEMLRRAGTNYDDVSNEGAVIIVNTEWECNFDKSAENCIPSYSFNRIDQTVNWTKGFNYRYANYYWIEDNSNNRNQYRDLYKVFGVRFIFIVSGYGRKFNIVPLFVNIGSGLALLSISSVVVDALILYVLPRRKMYHQAKYQEIDTEEKRKLLDPIQQQNLDS